MLSDDPPGYEQPAWPLRCLAGSKEEEEEEEEEEE